MTLSTYNVTYVEVCYIFTSVNDGSHKLVPYNHRNRHCALRPFVPLVNMQISAANSGSVHSN